MQCSAVPPRILIYWQHPSHSFTLAVCVQYSVSSDPLSSPTQSNQSVVHHGTPAGQQGHRSMCLVEPVSGNLGFTDPNCWSARHALATLANYLLTTLVLDTTQARQPTYLQRRMPSLPSLESGGTSSAGRNENLKNLCTIQHNGRGRMVCC